MTGAVGPCRTAGGSNVEASLVGIRPGVHPRTAGDHWYIHQTLQWIIADIDTV